MQTQVFQESQIPRLISIAFEMGVVSGACCLASATGRGFTCALRGQSPPKRASTHRSPPRLMGKARWGSFALFLGGLSPSKEEVAFQGPTLGASLARMDWTSRCPSHLLPSRNCRGTVSWNPAPRNRREEAAWRPVGVALRLIRPPLGAPPVGPGRPSRQECPPRSSGETGAG